MSRNYDSDGCGTYMFLIGLGITVIIGILIGTYSFLDNNKAYILENHIVLFYTSIVVISITFITVYLKQKRKYTSKIDDLEKEQKKIVLELQRKNHDIEKCLNKKEKELENIKDCMSKKDRLYESYNKLDIFNISSLYSDFLTLEYYLSAEWLEEKHNLLKHNPGFFKRAKGGRPAIRAAEAVKEYGARAKLYKKEYKMMLYKYEALLSLFPELSNYVDDIETIKLLTNYENIDTLKEEYDKVVDYISSEDYKRLNVNQRNQLALDKYINGRKSNWQIGRDYEMYCAYKYENQGWIVERFGIEKRLNDMGRDLIAKKGGIAHIIQCKLWSEHKLIHEKHIAQLYGSTIEYSISQERDLFRNEVVPVFITNINLSDTAKRFANRLGVKVYKWEMKEFPRIKCNVNNGEKIYHLPFDQQYDRTKIKNKEESYELTVKTASAKGFRRAKKYFFTNE